MSSRLKRIMKNPLLIFLTLGQRGFFNWIPDNKYLKIAYKIKRGGGRIRFRKSTNV